MNGHPTAGEARSGDVLEAAEEGPRRGRRRQAAAASLAASLPDASPALAWLIGAAAILFGRHLRFDAADPGWADRDLVLFGGAAAALAGPIAGLLAADDPGADMLMKLADGRSCLGAACGLALAERLMAARHGRSLVDHRIWVFASAADLASGAAQESASVAGHLRLGRLTVLVGADRPDAPGLAGFAGKGWAVRTAPYESMDAIGSAFSAALRSLRPTLIVCTGTLSPDPAASWQRDADIAQEQDAPETVWHAIGKRGATARRGWLKRLARHAARPDFERGQMRRLPPHWQAVLAEPHTLVPAGETEAATSETARAAFAALGAGLPDLVAVDSAAPCAASLPDRTRSPSHPMPWGSQMHAMGAALLGLAMHRGVVPVGWAQLEDAEAVLPALRIAGERAAPLVQVLAEPDCADVAWGRRAALRAIRHVFVFRPADAFEALECIELALRRNDGPSVVLVCGARTPLMSDRPGRIRCSRGGYVLRQATRARQVTLIASGVDVAAALEVRDDMAARGVAAAVVSLPCWELFARQDAAWRSSVLGEAPVVAIERGSGFGWQSWTGKDGLFVNPQDFQDGAGPGLPAAMAAYILARLAIQANVP